MDEKETGIDKKKQIILRISPKLWNELAAWAEDDFRSINGQIEYLLTEAVQQRRKKKTTEPNLT
uniref:Arc family DNA-binding protein n=1 Tax=Gracilinema caldarium TaxID=215591 RepID=A0A7C3E778_9SPIR